MKLQVKKKQGILEFRPTVRLELTESLDILAFLLGRQALFRERPSQTFANLKIANKAQVLEYWFKSGMIIGTPAYWCLSPSSLQTVLINFGSPGHLSFGANQKDPVNLYTLVGMYRKHLKTVPRGRAMGATLALAAKLRLLCRKVSPDVLAELIPKFFANRSWPDFSFEQFEKYVASKPRI